MKHHKVLGNTRTGIETNLGWEGRLFRESRLGRDTRLGRETSIGPEGRLYRKSRQDRDSKLIQPEQGYQPWLGGWQGWAICSVTTL